MPIHVAILLKPYIRLILAGRKTVESRLTITPRPPFRRVQIGERIYFKASSGPYMATAVAGEVEYHEGLTPERIAALRRQHNAAVCGDDAYWQWKRNSRYATLISLRDVEPTNCGPAIPSSRGIAWFTLADGTAPQNKTARPAGWHGRVRLPVLSGQGPRAHGGSGTQTPAPPSSAVRRSALGPPRQGMGTKTCPCHQSQLRAFAIVLTAGAIRNGYVAVPARVHRFPPECYGGTTSARAGLAVELFLPGGEVVESDVVAGRNLLRWRGWRTLFRAAHLAVGDAACFEPLGPRRYRVSFEKRS